jgi:hypothetical protein
MVIELIEGLGMIRVILYWMLNFVRLIVIELFESLNLVGLMLGLEAGFLVLMQLEVVLFEF